MDLSAYLDAAYAAIYQRLPEALPEFDFIALPNGKGYKSSNQLKIDGSTGSKKGAVYVYANAPFGLKDYTRGFISIYNYLQQRDQLSHREVVQLISQLSGLALPERPDNPTENEAYKKAIQISELMEAANDFFIDCLSHADNSFAKSKEATAIRNYLIDIRGYHVGHLRLPETAYERYKNQMELGYVPGTKEIHKYLTQQGFAAEFIEEHLNLPAQAGKLYVLTIPYRNHIGIIKGFALRTIIQELKGSKYLYTKGLNRGEILFNLKSHRQIHDLIIVEGMLDALNATANGLKNVVALGGAHLTKAQLERIIKVNPKQITLCLDNDEAGQKGMADAIQKLLPYSDQIRIYIAQLPKKIKDIDELIQKQGIEDAKTLIFNADTIAKYFSENLNQQITAQLTNGQRLTDKALNELIEKTVQIETQLKNPLDAALFRKEMLKILNPHTVTEEILSYKTEELQEIKAQKEYLKLLGELYRKIGKELREGKIKNVEQLFKDDFRQLKINSKAHQYQNLTKNQSEEELRAALLNTPKALQSGYQVDLYGEQIPVLLPSGAISFFCAPTSHGKTTMLINLALNVAHQYPDQQIHFFSYEESREPITLKSINAYLDLELGDNNIQALENYFRTANLQYIPQKLQSDFYQKKEQFFKDLILSKRLNIHYIDYSSDELIDAIYYLNKKQHVGAIFIDYMQLLRLSDQNKGRLSRQEELKRICLDLKDCAVETKLPLILGAQFNREVVNPFRVHSTKIGEAGDIERIASVVVGMWNNDFEPTHLFADEEARLDEICKANTIWIKILKNRTGKVGGQNLLPYNGNKGRIYPAGLVSSNSQNNTIKF